jgi:outer membrane lipoprotein-sorting protein
MDMGMMGLSASLTLYTAEPNLMLMEINIPGLGKMINGCDGEIVWGLSPMSGPTIKEGQAAEESLDEATFHGYDWRAKYTDVKLEGMETIEGEECHKILATPKIGNPRTQYYSRSTGLLVRVDSVTQTEMGEFSGQTVNTDYRKVDGVMVPFKLIQKAAGQTMTMTFTEIKNNVDLPKSTFDPPDEIKALQGGDCCAGDHDEDEE